MRKQHHGTNSRKIQQQSKIESQLISTASTAKVKTVKTVSQSITVGVVEKTEYSVLLICTQYCSPQSLGFNQQFLSCVFVQWFAVVSTTVKREHNYSIYICWYLMLRTSNGPSPRIFVLDWTLSMICGLVGCIKKILQINKFINSELSFQYNMNAHINKAIAASPPHENSVILLILLIITRSSIFSICLQQCRWKFVEAVGI